MCPDGSVSGTISVVTAVPSSATSRRDRRRSSRSRCPPERTRRCATFPAITRPACTSSSRWGRPVAAWARIRHAGTSGSTNPKECDVANPNKEAVELLANVPLFSELSKKELQSFASAAKEVRHKPGDALAREGDSGLGFFLIADGTAAVTVGGKPRAKLGPGDFFGEIALLE